MTDTQSNIVEPTYDSILDVKQGTLGDTYTTRGIVVANTGKGLLITEDDAFIFVYLGAASSYVKGDYVEVTGTTSTYGDAVQMNSDSVVTKLSTETYSDPSTYTELTANDVTNLTSGFNVGEYIQITGVVSVSGSYINFIIDGSSVVGSLNNPDIDFNAINGETLKVTGYILYLSGSSTRYLNIFVTDTETTSASQVFDLTILTINDLHGHIEQDEYGMNGLSNTAYLIDQIRNENPFDDVLLIGNGDMFQGTAISNMTYGSVVIEAMNMMEFDAMGIGNHDFDWDLDTVLAYFDGNPNNGEADFPLLNANIYYEVDDTLVIISGGNMFEYVVIEKEGIQVGVISYVGDIFYSIAYNRSLGYYFDLDLAGSVQSIATDLKDNGVDVIVVNIHDGNREDIKDFYFNQQLAALTDTSGNYLVDVVINGHAHAKQADMILRSNGSPCMLIQAGGNNAAFGEIVLSIDTSTMEIVNQSVAWVDVVSAGTNYDVEIENYIDQVSAALGDPILTVAGETVNERSDLYAWVGNVMLNATDTDVAISNLGGVRSTGGITAGQNVTLSQLYEISPFDNTVVVMELTYDEIQTIISNTNLFYEVKSGVTLQQGQTYRVSIIDYVYYWTQWESMRSSADIDTALYIRDLLIEDLTIKGEKSETFKPITDPSSDVETKVVYYD